jgi:hypothetical protein
MLLHMQSRICPPLLTDLCVPCRHSRYNQGNHHMPVDWAYEIDLCFCSAPYTAVGKSCSPQLSVKNLLHSLHLGHAAKAVHFNAQVKLQSQPRPAPGEKPHFSGALDATRQVRQ